MAHADPEIEEMRLLYLRVWEGSASPTHDGIQAVVLALRQRWSQKGNCPGCVQRSEMLNRAMSQRNQARSWVDRLVSALKKVRVYVDADHSCECEGDHGATDEALKACEPILEAPPSVKPLAFVLPGDADLPATDMQVDPLDITPQQRTMIQEALTLAACAALMDEALAIVMKEKGAPLSPTEAHIFRQGMASVSMAHREALTRFSKATNGNPENEPTSPGV